MIRIENDEEYEILLEAVTKLISLERPPSEEGGIHDLVIMLASSIERYEKVKWPLGKR